MKNLEQLGLVALDAAQLQEVKGGLGPLAIYGIWKAAVWIGVGVAVAISTDSCDDKPKPKE
jgi:lactobin A/cerein 7B family class IIb bacteriocin